MKKKFSKILGVGLTLALLTSLLLTAAPVSADVSQPAVSLDVEEISASEEYTISFSISDDLALDEYIMVEFPDDTNVDNFDSAVRVNGATYALGAIVHAITYDGGTYKCTVAGVAGGSPPTTWDTDVGDPTTDGAVTWTCVTKTRISAIAGIGGTSPSPDSEEPGKAIVADTDDLTLEIDIPTTTTIGRLAVLELVIEGVINPTDTGTYTLRVKTEAGDDDDYVESASYDIDAPTVGGFVYVYNASNVLLATFGGRDALNSANIGATLDGEDYTYKIGPGTYELANSITISGDDVTFESSEGAENTIIDIGTYGITVTGDEVTIDGFTIEADGAAFIIKVQGEDATIENNIITAEDGYPDGINLKNATGATVSGNELDINSTMMVIGALECTLSDNVFGAGINVQDSTDITITDNEIIGAEYTGIRFEVTNSEDILIEGNTISETIDAEGAGIIIFSPVTVNNLEILNNKITDNEEVGILIEAGATWGTGNVIKFNTITGDGDGIICDGDVVGDVDVDATFNWWGTTDADDIGDMVSSNVTYEPFLTDTAEAVIVGGKATTNASSLDAKDEAGVKVSGVDDGDDPLRDADVISALKYAANPEEAISDAIAFYDVYIILEDGIVLEDVSAKIKFYDDAINTGSVAHFWTGDFWAECSDQLARDGVVYVDLTEDTVPAFDELEGTPFVVVAGEAEALLAAPVISAPESGAEDVALKPTLAWGTVADAIGYDFELADNPLFVIPIASLTGDLGRLITPFYAQVAELDYSTYYYWRVKAVSADAESVWSSGVFMTVAIPEPEAEVWMCSEGLTFDSRAALEAHLATAEAHQPVEPADIIVEPPDIIVPLPAVTPITPAWIYVIIGVGAVLVIGLIVLIVRTRRVA